MIRKIQNWILKKVEDFDKQKCPYWQRCPPYQKDGATCNHPTAHDGYCGLSKKYANQ